MLLAAAQSEFAILVGFTNQNGCIALACYCVLAFVTTVYCLHLQGGWTVTLVDGGQHLVTMLRSIWALANNIILLLIVIAYGCIAVDVEINANGEQSKLQYLPQQIQASLRLCFVVCYDVFNMKTRPFEYFI